MIFGVFFCKIAEINPTFSSPVYGLIENPHPIASAFQIKN
jgi:hypothetical protein